MSTSAPDLSDGLVTLPAAELRESLENILSAISASAHSCSEESRALEVQRQRVLTLLFKLDRRRTSFDSLDTTVPRHGTLLSPVSAETTVEHGGSLHVFVRNSESADARTDAPGDQFRTAFREDDKVHARSMPHPYHRCLLGNLFSQSIQRDMTAPLAYMFPCVSSPPSLSRGEADGLEGDGEKDSGVCAASTRLQQMGQLCCSPAALPSFSNDEGGSGRGWHDLASRVQRHSRVDEDSPKPQEMRSCAPSAQVNTQNSRQWNSDTTVSRSFWINVWPCYGGTSASHTQHPTRVLVRGRYRYIEEVMEKAAKLTNCRPASHGFYTPDGCPIRNLESLVPEQHYLLFPFGGFYRRQTVPTALLWQLYSDARHIVQCL
nr:unnamed protein product [Leishmania braziliensis]